MPPLTVNGSPPTPTETVVSPIRLFGPHVPSLACGSGHSSMLDSTPERPGGSFASTDCRFCSPSERVIVSVNGENSPAWMFVAPPVNDGENGRLAPGHGPPFGPEVIWKLERRPHRRVTRPRRKRRFGRIRPTARRGRQRRAFPTEEMQFGVFERRAADCFRTSRRAAPPLRRSCPRSLHPRPTQLHLARELHERPRHGVFRDDVHRDTLPNGFASWEAR